MNKYLAISIGALAIIATVIIMLSWWGINLLQSRPLYDGPLVDTDDLAEEIDTNSLEQLQQIESELQSRQFVSDIDDSTCVDLASQCDQICTNNENENEQCQECQSNLFICQAVITERGTNK